MRHYLRLLFLCVISMVLASPHAYAAITGSISGRVLDSTGAVIPGGNVTALNGETGIRQTVTTNGEGFYIFSALNIGLYNVSVSKTGFKDYQATGIKVDANSALRIDIPLVLGSISETEEVRAD